jgi:hypothetical protein
MELELLLALEWGQDLVLEYRLELALVLELVLMSEFVWGVQVEVSKRVYGSNITKRGSHETSTKPECH